MIKTFTIRGEEKSWLSDGDPAQNKPVLFFIHGFPDSPETWKSQIRFFAPNYHIIAPSLRSLTKDSRRLSIDSVVLDFHQILQAEGIPPQSPITVIGHDIGGVYAWEFSRSLKGQLKGLISIAGPSLEQMKERIGSYSQLRKSWYIAVFQIPILSEKLFSHFGAYKIQEERKRSSLPALPISSSTLGMIRHYRATMNTFIRSSLFKKREKFKKPVLVLWGAKDPFLDPPSSNEMSNISENFEIRLLPHRHWPHEENPDKVNELIKNFIERSI
jgi:epoxide hydrolase 4